MYRGKKSLEQVIGMFDGSTGDEIKARIRGTKSTETGSCSAKCLYVKQIKLICLVRRTEMNDNQKIGMTDGDDSQELQPTCMQAPSRDAITTQITKD